MLTRRLIAMTAAVVAMAACSLDKQSAPPLAGPSELGLSLQVTATPDILSWDGASVATIDILARDANGQPAPPTTLRLLTSGADFGTLSTKVTQTDANGRARVTYTAPPAPSPLEPGDVVVTIEVLPVGNNAGANQGNYAGTLSRLVEIRLMRPGVIGIPGAAPVSKFDVSPKDAKAGDDVFFNASASTGTIVSYNWQFGDGDSQTTGGPFTEHSYDAAGQYVTVLTVTDDKGRTHQSSQTVTVGAPTGAPTATFVFSPSAPRVGTVINFNASASKADTNRRLINYTWDFGDGSPLANTGGPTVQKAFGLAGKYKVTLLVTDDQGRTAATTIEIEILP